MAGLGCRVVVTSQIVQCNLIEFQTREGYGKSSWLKEADRHFISAKLLRRIKKRRRTRFRNSADDSNRLGHVLAMDATTHSSMLLIGYAVELFLKAGITKLYVGCSKSLFEREIKHCYSHNLVKLAKDVEFPLLSHNRRRLKRLKKIILSEGRYPNFANNRKEEMEFQNKRAGQFWSDDKFEDFCNLATSIREHVSHIDQDADNLAIYEYRGIDQDGYFAFRCGGKLSPRVTVKFSSVQRHHRTNNKRALKRLIWENLSNPQIKKYWETAQYRCVKV